MSDLKENTAEQPRYPATERDIIYLYDGSWRGLLCAVFESYEQQEIPAGIEWEFSAQQMLRPQKQIETNPFHAKRVENSVVRRISKQALELIQLGFLSCVEEKELLILRFLRIGYEVGAKVMQQLANPTVNALFQAVKRLTHEAHLLTGFVRFSVHGNLLAATIGPKNCVLPLVQQHFCERYPNESFLLYDRTHQLALVHTRECTEILPLEDFTEEEPEQQEQEYRNLWKLFHKTVSIAGRENAKRQLGHLPKRYWEFMPEFSD